MLRTPVDVFALDSDFAASCLHCDGNCLGFFAAGASSMSVALGRLLRFVALGFA